MMDYYIGALSRVHLNTIQLSVQVASIQTKINVCQNQMAVTASSLVNRPVLLPS